MTQTRQKNWAIAVFLTIACLVLVILGGYLTAHFEEHRAIKLISILSSAVPGSTSQESLRQELEHQAFRTGTSNNCAVYKMTNCDQFFFSNKLLALLHLAPAKYVWVTLDYRNGVVVSKSVQFAEDPRISAVSCQLLRQDESPSDDSENQSHRVTVNIFSADNAIVKIYDNEYASADQLQKDWRIDLSCLYKIGVCRDPRVVMPDAF